MRTTYNNYNKCKKHRNTSVVNKTSIYVSFAVAIVEFETDGVEETCCNAFDSGIDGTEESSSDDRVGGTDGMIGIGGITADGKTVGNFTESDLSLRKQKKTNISSDK